MVGILTAPTEIQYFGKKFTILRNVLSLAAALGIAVVMGVALQ